MRLLYPCIAVAWGTYNVILACIGLAGLRDALVLSCVVLSLSRLMRRILCMAQTHTRYADDARRPASNELKDAAMNRTKTISGE